MNKANYDSYEQFNTAKSACRSCPIGKIYNKVVCSDGNTLNPKVIICGEAPGADEIEEGRPFVGKAGKLLRSTLNEMGFGKGNSLITNVIPCRPEDNKFPSDDGIVKRCFNNWLKQEILLTNPDFLVLVGAKPLKFLLNMEGITKLRGKWQLRKVNGKVLQIMPTYHPSFINRNIYTANGKKLLEQFRSDIKQVAIKAKFIENE